MARRTKEDAEKTRQIILQTALDTFCEKGYSKATFDEIAKRINLTKGAIYWHFRNKPDLLSAIIQEAFTRVEEHINQKIPHIKDIKDLKGYFLYNAELIKKHQGFRKFLFFMIFQMEWSESIYNKISNDFKDLRDFPLNRIKETLTLLQKSGEIAPNINIYERSEIFLNFWETTVGNEISKTSSADFLDFISKGFDLIISSLQVGRS